MESNKEEKITSVSEENIYKLNGRVPLISLPIRCRSAGQ